MTGTFFLVLTMWCISAFCAGIAIAGTPRWWVGALSFIIMGLQTGLLILSAGV